MLLSNVHPVQRAVVLAVLGEILGCEVHNDRNDEIVGRVDSKACWSKETSVVRIM
jgi:hypothetical protein